MSGSTSSRAGTCLNTPRISLSFTSTHSGRPDWVEVSDKEMRGIFKTVPAREDVLPDINENLVVELYSK